MRSKSDNNNNVQVMLLGDELEKTQTAAKGDIRRLSVELQGLRDEQAALSRQAAKMNVRGVLSHLWMYAPVKTLAHM